MEAPPSGGPSTPTPPPPAPPFGGRPPRQLRRRPDEGPLGGVCAGVADYFGIDPVIVRIAAVVLAFSGPGVFAYVLAWIFVPAADAGTPPSHHPGGDRHDRGAQIFGILLLAVAVSILWGGWWSPARRWMFPIGLIVLGGWLLLRRDDRPDDVAPPSPDVPPTPAPWAAPLTSDPDATAELPATEPTLVAGAPTDPAAEAAAEDLPADQAAEAGEPPGTAPPAQPGAGGAGAGLPPWDRHRGWHRGHGGPWEPTEEERAARRRRRMVFPIVLGALLVWAGVAFLAGVSVESGLAVALCIVGIGFVLGAFVGGSKALIIPAFVLAAALVTTTVLDLPLNGPVGHRTWTPDSVAQIEDHYEMSTGEGVLDLTELDLEGRSTIPIRATIGIGHLVLRVPDDVALRIDAEASAGDIEILGRSDSGIGVSTTRSIGLDAHDTVLDLDLEVGLGQIEIIAEPADRADSTTSTTAGTLG